MQTASLGVATQVKLSAFKSGHFAAELFERTNSQKNVRQRAHFAAIFQEMVEEYKPHGPIEFTMLEVLAVNYFLWRYWIMEHLQHATTEARQESDDYKEWQQRENNYKNIRIGEQTRHNTPQGIGICFTSVKPMR